MQAELPNLEVSDTTNDDRNIVAGQQNYKLRVTVRSLPLRL